MAQIEERGAELTGRATKTGAAAMGDHKAAERAMWALGDYHRFAKQTVWEIGPVLVEACGITAGQRVLDVAAGTGNVAIRAAEAGADVVASDLTPENFEAGRREAESRGVQLQWVEADAEALPSGDGEFDVVTSSFGAMFAPDHKRVADELLRVCRPGGTVGMANFTPEGLAAGFFQTFARYAPPPPDRALPPVLWGSEEHVRELFGGRVGTLDLTRRVYVERAASPRAYVDLFTETFGPVIGLHRFLADQPDRLAALESEFLEFATRENRGEPDGPAEYPYEYLLVVARRRDRDEVG
jgi:ubiquinone/menaquinone biosynthesis C-methylase UbiE